jgi:hypothetical protein
LTRKLIFSSRWTLPSKIIFLCVDRCAGRPDDSADGIVRNWYLSENAGGTPHRLRSLPMPGEKTLLRGAVELVSRAEGWWRRQFRSDARRIIYRDNRISENKTKLLPRSAKSARNVLQLMLFVADQSNSRN